MKNSIIKAAVSAAVCSAVILSAAALTAFAEAAKGYTVPEGLDVDSSEVKPSISISQLSLPYNDTMKNNRIQTIQISIKNATGKYAPTGIHVEYDKRLKLVENEDGDPATLKQSALKISEAVKDGDNGIFLTTGAKSDAGKDGALWDIDFEIPSDAKLDDKYDITVYYKENDLFTNVADDEAGQLMQAYTFGYGIENGFIEFYSDHVEPFTSTTKSTTTTTTTTTTATTTSTTSTASETAKPPVTQAATTTAKPKTTGKNNSPKTGVAGAGLAAAGLAIAVGTAFALRKKED